jgi:uncharacterized protein YqkB
MKKKYEVCLELVGDLADKLNIDISGLSLAEAVKVIQNHESESSSNMGSVFCDHNECLFYEDCLKISINEQEK